MVVVRVNERVRDGEDPQVWACINGADEFKRLLFSLVKIAEVAPEGTKVPEIIREAVICGGDDAKLQTALIAAEKLWKRRIEAKYVKSVMAWYSSRRSSKLIVSIYTHRSRHRHDRERERKIRAGATS